MLSPALRILLFAVPFSVRRMFFMGEPGLHLEAITPAQNAVNPTMFQDSAGTTPITAVEQPVGLWLDSKLGAGVSGPELSSYAAGFASTSGISVSAATVELSGSSLVVTSTGAAGNNYAVVPVAAGMVVDKWYRVTVMARQGAQGTKQAMAVATFATVSTRAVSGTTSTPYTYNVKATATSGSLRMYAADAAGAVGDSLIIDSITVREIPGNHVSQSSAGARPTYTRRVNLLNATATLSTQNVTTVAASYRLTFTGTGTVTLSGTSTAGPLVGTGANDRVSLTFTATAGTLTLTVSGSVTLADLRPSSIAALNIPAYQRVTSSTDYDTEGFPPMVRGNGTSQWMSGTLDMSSTDKVLIVAGVTKYSDASAGCLFELTTSTANAGAVALWAPPSAAASVRFYSRGTGAASAADSTVSSIAAPVSAVLSGISDIANDVCVVRRDGVASAGSVVDQGTGNYANSTLYLLARAGVSNWSSAGITSLTIRGGDGSAWVSRLENYVKNLMRLSY